MADVQRWRHSDPKRVRRFPVDSATVIEVGDMCWQSTDDIRPANGFTYVTSSLTQTQANFRRDFKGVAMDASANGDTADIAVATLGTFLFACAAATFEIGDRVGPDDNAAGDTLLDQTVIGLSENDLGEIGQVSRRYSANTTAVECEINPFGQLVSAPLFIPLGTALHTTAEDLVTDYAVEFPFKLVRLHAIHMVAAAGQSVLSVDNGATALDDTLSLTSGAAKGVHDVVAMDDATGDDIFEAGDILSVASDGGATAGEVFVMLEVLPFLHQD